MPELEYASEEELIDEIRNRYSSMALCILRDHKTNSGLEMTQCFYGGGKAQAVGLLEVSKHRLLKEYNESTD